jgi:hypothetical protein
VTLILCFDRLENFRSKRARQEILSKEHHEQLSIFIAFFCSYLVY